MFLGDALRDDVNEYNDLYLNSAVNIKEIGMTDQRQSFSAHTENRKRIQTPHTVSRAPDPTDLRLKYPVFGLVEVEAVRDGGAGAFVDPRELCRI